MEEKPSCHGTKSRACKRQREHMIERQTGSPTVIVKDTCIRPPTFQSVPEQDFARVYFHPISGNPLPSPTTWSGVDDFQQETSK